MAKGSLKIIVKSRSMLDEINMNKMLLNKKEILLNYIYLSALNFYKSYINDMYIF